MSKRVMIVHRWLGSPEEDWIPWLRGQLIARGFRVQALPMPDPEHPHMIQWVSHLQEQVGHCDDETFFVGHSIGCQTILRYLEQLPMPVRCGGLVLVAPWVRLKRAAAKDLEDARIAEPWLINPIHWEAISGKVKHVEAIFSDNDYYVPVEDAKIFQTGINAQISVLHRRGHFSKDDGITQLPEALEALERMMNGYQQITSL